VTTHEYSHPDTLAENRERALSTKRNARLVAWARRVERRRRNLERQQGAEPRILTESPFAAILDPCRRK
jgi:hypothetical protein